MSPAAWKLFAHASHSVTPQDVYDFCPNDPGFPGYVRAFTSILRERKPPSSANFDITETINLTRWGNAEEERDPDRFRRFRIFTNAVAVTLCLGDDGPDDTPPNYTCVSLLDDACALQNSELIGLLFPVFGEMHRTIGEAGWYGDANEKPFLVLAQLLIALLGHAPDSDISALCDQLMREEAACKDNVTGEFLWGCTSFNQLHYRWKALVDVAFPKQSDIESLLLLRAMLLD